MILNAASALYGTAARWRRAWYEAEPSRRRRLQNPVISIGNLRAGGAGKTPVAIEVARFLEAQGERPAILLRGYARVSPSDGVTIVSDGDRICADLGHAGDEAMLLARTLPSIPVLVCEDRYLAGCLAERRLGATVHVLDDGFQHFRLQRDVDLLVVDGDDLSEALLPAGRLREPVETAARADALVTAADEAAVGNWRKRVRGPVFRMSRRLGTARWLSGDGVVDTVRTAAFALAGIARPGRFLADLESAGWRIVGRRIFPDHHQFTAGDVASVVSEANASGAAVVVTTEKDAVRLEGLPAASLPLLAVPLETTIEPPFGHWLVERLAQSRTRATGVNA